MKIKQRAEDFSVKESWRFDEVEDGKFRVYLMDKQKLSTFDAIERIRERFGLRPGLISFCGLKDKQGRTEQLIAVEGVDVDLQEPNLRLKPLGRTNRPLSAANTTSNRFSVTVRALGEEDIARLPISSAEVNRLGVVNYFDSQRFGSLKHGQGFIAKDLIRGDFEAALRNYMAQPSPLDRTGDAKVKAFWRENWGKWTKKAPFEANAKYYRILNVLRESPKDFAKAFLQIDSNYRALLLFTYQSYLWNEGVRRLLQLMLPREQLFPMPYQAGTLLFHKDADAPVLRELRELRFPLLAPNSTFSHPKVKEAVEWVLGKEKLKLEDLRIEGASRLLYFKHEERDVLVYPGKLVLGRPGRDELNPGFRKLNVAFTLPPGSYATLVIKRLFHFAWLEEDYELPPLLTPAEGETDARPSRQSESAIEKAKRAGGSRGRTDADGGRGGAPRGSRDRGEPRAQDTRPEAGRPRALAGREGAKGASEVGRATSARTTHPRSEAPAPEVRPPAEKLGFREQARRKKAAREKARAETAKHLKSKKK